MLRLEDTQVAALVDDQADRIADQIARDFAAEHPDLCAPHAPGALRNGARRAVADARALGLDRFRELRVFAYLHLFVGDRFPDAPRPAAFLAPRPEGSGFDRMAEMMAGMRPAEWEALRADPAMRSPDHALS